MKRNFNFTIPQLVILSVLGVLLNFWAINAQVTSEYFQSAFKSLPDQPAKVDSLNKLIRDMEENNAAIAAGLQILKLAEQLDYKKGAAQALNNMGVAYYEMGKNNEALEYHEKALLIRKALGDQKDIAASYNNIGNSFDKLGNKKEAIGYHTKALQIREEIKDTSGMAKSYNNIASAYLDIPDYYKAIENGFKALKLFQAMGSRTNLLASILNNLGNAYQNLKEYDKAMRYYQQALTIQKELGDMNEIARMLNNIANIYVVKGEAENNSTLKRTDFITALENYSKALSILENTDNREMEALVNSNIGNIYWALNDFPKALNYLKISLASYEAIENKSGIGSAYNNLSKHYQLQKNFIQSNKYALQALSLAESIADPEQILNACEYLSSNFYELKQFEKSLLYYKRYVLEKDKLTDVEGAKKLVEEESRLEFEKREQKLKLEQEKKDAIAEAEALQQRLIIWSAGVGLLLLIVFSGFIYNRFRVTQKQNRIIEKQTAQMQEKNSALETANSVIAQKNKDITDSIQYAKRIQRALLASDTLLHKNLPEYFVFYRPKDIVSGDFYWANQVNGKFLIITADCTGHGVPGAFMSLLNISLLNEITLQRKISSPDLILNSVRDRIISILNPEGTDTESKDGMDCMLCSFDIPNNQLEFAAANNPLWILKNGSNQMEEYKPDKQPVGFHSIYKPFTLQTVAIEKGDTVYSFTDGFADQFGGPKGKKFKYKKLEDLILAYAHLPMSDQKDMLEKKLVEWQGDLEQVDDVLIIGVRI